MSRDVIIHSPLAEPVPLKELVESLVVDGERLSWRPDRIPGRPLDPWDEGDVAPGDDRDPAHQVTVSIARTRPSGQPSVLRSLAGPVPDEIRDRLLAGRTMYILAVPWSGNPRRERMLRALVTELARRADGVIVDTYDNRPYTAETYRPPLLDADDLPSEAESWT